MEVIKQKWQKNKTELGLNKTELSKAYMVAMETSI